MNKRFMHVYEPMAGGLDKMVIDVAFQFPLETDIENDYAIVMQEMENLWKQIDDKFLNKEKTLGITELTDKYLILAARLKIIAEQRLYNIAADKVKYAPHPSFPA